MSTPPVVSTTVAKCMWIHNVQRPQWARAQLCVDPVRRRGPKDSLLGDDSTTPERRKRGRPKGSTNRKRGHLKGSKKEKFTRTSSRPTAYRHILALGDGNENLTTLNQHASRVRWQNRDGDFQSQPDDALRLASRHEEDASVAQADCDLESLQMYPKHSIVTHTDSDPQCIPPSAESTKAESVPKRPRGRPRKVILCYRCALTSSPEQASSLNPLVHAAVGTVNCTGGSMNTGVNPTCQSSGSSLGTGGEETCRRKRLVCEKCSQTFTRVCLKYRVAKTRNMGAAKLLEDFRHHNGKQMKFQSEGQRAKKKRGQVPRLRRLQHREQDSDTPEPSVCPECGLFFAWHSALKLHLRRHERKEKGERPFSSRSCTKSFLTAGELKHHRMDVHEGVRRFLCTICGSTFKRRFALNSHLKLHEGVEKHMCPVCGKVFPLSQYLKRHMAFHDPESVYHCQYCPKSYSTKSSLSVHLLKSRVCPGSQMGPGRKTETSELSK